MISKINVPSAVIGMPDYSKAPVKTYSSSDYYDPQLTFSKYV